MQYYQLTRLHVNDSLDTKNIILANSADIHYLINVMRKKINDQFLVFNNIDGEYLAKVSEIKTKFLTLELIEKIRSSENEPEITLIFAPIKHPRISFLLEKATELGVTKLIPIKTKHAVVDKINLTKWHIYVKEASEQCRRLSVPKIFPLIDLAVLLKTWDESQAILLCNEHEQSLHLSAAPKSNNLTIMIGPEGGFSATELELLLKQTFVTSTHLGERILRSETAALCALSILNY